MRLARECLLESSNSSVEESLKTRLVCSFRENLDKSLLTEVNFEETGVLPSETEAKKFRSEINEGTPILETLVSTFVVASSFSQQQQQQFIHKQEIMFYSYLYCMPRPAKSH